MVRRLCGDRPPFPAFGEYDSGASRHNNDGGVDLDEGGDLCSVLEHGVSPCGGGDDCPSI